jgi:hypothetical protein
MSKNKLPIAICKFALDNILDFFDKWKAIQKNDEK